MNNQTNRRGGHRAVRVHFRVLGLLLLGVASVSGQTVFNALVSGQGGPVHGLFEMQNGTVTPINTGLVTNHFPALSRDGRFITIAAPDPAQPNQVATDLFIYDRVEGTRRTLVNYTAAQQPDGSFVTPHAQFSALSPSNQLFVLNTLQMVTTNQSGSNSVPMLTVHQTSDGMQLAIAEIGQGNALDFFRAEYVGIAWAPDGSYFATPAYVPVMTQTGQVHSSVGIVQFGFNQQTNQWQRVGQLTQPSIFDSSIPAVIQTHILPAISPNGQRLAFFEITWPDALLQGAATARLLAINTDGSNPMVLANFNPGFYPLGVTWSTDGSEVIYSIAPQTQVPGAGFSPSGEPQGAVIRSVSSINPVTINQVPGIDAGFFPSNPMVAGSGGNGGGDAEPGVAFFGDDLFVFGGSEPGTDQWYFSFTFKSLYHFSGDNWYYFEEFDAMLWIAVDSGSLADGFWAYAIFPNGHSTWIYLGRDGNFGDLRDSNGDGTHDLDDSEAGSQPLKGYMVLEDPMPGDPSGSSWYYFEQFPNGNYIINLSLSDATSEDWHKLR